MATGLSLDNQRMPLRHGIVALASSNGWARLCEASAGSSALFVAVARFFERQMVNGCGIASLAIGLNAVNSAATGSREPQTTQDSLRRALTERLGDAGSLEELCELGNAHADGTCRLRTVRSTDSSCEQFRADAVRTIKEGGCALVSFSRHVLGYEASPFAGHTSPLAAYHAPSDSFLLMDVDVAAHPCCWVPAGLLFRGMLSVEPATSTPRGYLLLSPEADPLGGLICVECDEEEEEEEEARVPPPGLVSPGESV